ncbi:MAG: serine/threonine protein kinase, partial [Xanthomonadaceae bacterium]|nr:serine/threonine protein kinase [Xanthomonadaceae bacterium]
MNAEESIAVAHLCRHLALPRRLRPLHLAWLRRRDRAGASALEGMLALADAPEIARLDTLAHATLLATAPRRDDRAEFSVGDRLGAWRIDSLLGVGGMGHVFRAYRDDGAYLQQVAIKRMRAGVASKTSTESFLREREILARLNHPGISRLIDGGVDAEGRPWLAMELIDGERIDTWCDRRRRTPRERTQLFLQVCDAVQYAHRHGVLHGDIKPENILVDDEGRSKLVDFGVAALLEDADSDAFCVGLTEAYAAPERLAHDAKGFASDIYALGAVLCRLLVGASPPQSPVSALCALLDAEEATAFRPDTLIERIDAATLDARGLPHRRALTALLDGDLGAILGKCLRARPEERYDSAAALAEDLRCWLASRPVAAVGGRSGYRLRKALSRHRFAVATAAVVCAAFALGVGYSRFAAGAAEARLAELQVMLEDSLGPPTAI